MKQLWMVVVLCVALGSAASAVVFDSSGFEGYAIGDLPGQFGWVEDTSGGYSAVQVVADPTGSSMGNVIVLDPPGTAGGWQGVANAFGPTTAPLVVVEWDQWRADTGDNLWYADDPDFSRFWAMQWDQNDSAFARQFNASVPLTSAAWQHITYTLDFAAGTATVDVDGSFNTDAAMPPGDGPVRGWAWELEPTEAQGEGGPTYIDNFVVNQIPEPATLTLLGLGLGWLARRRR